MHSQNAKNENTQSHVGRSVSVASLLSPMSVFLSPLCGLRPLTWQSVLRTGLTDKQTNLEIFLATLTGINLSWAAGGSIYVLTVMTTY